MQVLSISLQNFRNHTKSEFTFTKGITLFVGPNAIGKTNILEAVYLLATGKSFRAEVESEMIQSGQGVAWVKGLIQADSDKTKLEIILTTGKVNGSRAAKKRYLVNGVARRMTDFVGNLKVVYFGPQDMEIIVSSPSIRRNYLDSVLEQVDREYRRASLSYRKGIRQRNRLLEQIRDEGKPRSILYFWDRLLIENGQLITAKRKELIDFINGRSWGFGQLKIEYDQSLISTQRLEQYANQEVAAGVTLVGPHRDDFRVMQIEGDSGSLKSGQSERDLAVYGSRGEQRTAIFSLKLAELEFIGERSEEKPILLLDDIFSELDHEHRHQLMAVIPRQQTILTTSDIHLVEPKFRQKLDILKLP